MPKIDSETEKLLKELAEQNDRIAKLKSQLRRRQKKQERKKEQEREKVEEERPQTDSKPCDTEPPPDSESKGERVILCKGVCPLASSAGSIPAAGHSSELAGVLATEEVRSPIISSHRRIQKRRSARKAMAGQPLLIELSSDAVTESMVDLNASFCGGTILHDSTFKGSEFKLPKEYTSLKLEKMRERKVLNKRRRTSDYLNENIPLESSQVLDTEESHNPDLGEGQDTVESAGREASAGSSQALENDLSAREKLFGVQFDAESVYCASLDTVAYICVVFSSNMVGVWRQSDNTWQHVKTVKSAESLDIGRGAMMFVDKSKICLKQYTFGEETSLTERCAVLTDGSSTVKVTSYLILKEKSRVLNETQAKVDPLRAVVYYTVKPDVSRGVLLWNPSGSIEIRLQPLATLPGSVTSVNSVGPDLALVAAVAEFEGKASLYLSKVSTGACVKVVSLEGCDVPARVVSCRHTAGSLALHCIVGRSVVSVLAVDLRSGVCKQELTCRLPGRIAVADTVARVAGEKLVLLCGLQVYLLDLQAGVISHLELPASAASFDLNDKIICCENKSMLLYDV